MLPPPKCFILSLFCPPSIFTLPGSCFPCPPVNLEIFKRLSQYQSNSSMPAIWILELLVFVLLLLVKSKIPNILLDFFVFDQTSSCSSGYYLCCCTPALAPTAFSLMYFDGTTTSHTGLIQSRLIHMSFAFPDTR